MIKDMYSVMQRINHIRNKFGLKRHNIQTEKKSNDNYDAVLKETQKQGEVSGRSGSFNSADKNTSVKGIASLLLGNNGISSSLVKTITEKVLNNNTQSGSSKSLKDNGKYFDIGNENSKYNNSDYKTNIPGKKIKTSNNSNQEQYLKNAINAYLKNR